MLHTGNPVDYLLMYPARAALHAGQARRNNGAGLGNWFPSSRPVHLSTLQPRSPAELPSSVGWLAVPPAGHFFSVVSIAFWRSPVAFTGETSMLWHLPSETGETVPLQLLRFRGASSSQARMTRRGLVAFVGSA